MSLKSPEKADRTEERSIIKFSVNLSRAPIETKKKMRKRLKHQNRSRSFIYRDNSDFLMEHGVLSSGQTINAAYHSKVNRGLRHY